MDILTVSIRACACAHAFQDARYGPGRRLHNFARNGGRSAVKGPGWKCTVCGKVSEATAKKIEKPKGEPTAAPVAATARPTKRKSQFVRNSR